MEIDSVNKENTQLAFVFLKCKILPAISVFSFLVNLVGKRQNPVKFPIPSSTSTNARQTESFPQVWADIFFAPGFKASI